MLRKLTLTLLLATTATAAASRMTVVLDPGHGGRDDGAVRDGVLESRITLEVALKLAARLEKDRRFKVHLTRRGDQSLTLFDRALAAKEKDADVFVSIHVNSNPDAGARGAEFYFQNQLAPDEESMMLAHRENSEGEEQRKSVEYGFLERHRYPADVSSIVKDLLDGDRVLKSSQLAKSLKTSWRGSRKTKSSTVRQAPFYVLSQMTSPSALVELGFLTNPEEMKELQTAAVQNRMADDLFRGLVEFKESMDKADATP